MLFNKYNLTKQTQIILFVLFFLLVSRLISMNFVPLNDSTESRYGEIARIMLTTGDWITPMHQPGVPFWAKPPLSTWLSALSMKFFGINELAARLPALILSVAVLWMVWGVAKTRNDDQSAWLSVLILASSVYFLLDAGTVMTDPALLFCTSFALIAFWHAINHNRAWGYLFFVALGLGLLAKGPVALVLVGMPIFTWVLMKKKWRDVWRFLPWIKGGWLLFAIAIPWYWLAEHKTPGFLNYFIVGENINRFLQPGWAGDKYGYAHVAPYGMIWVYAIIGIFPWLIPGVTWLTRHVKVLPALCKDEDGWVSYLLLCTFLPLIFFTFARNIIYPYVFPSLPFFALLFAELLKRSEVSQRVQQQLIGYAFLTGIIFLLITGVFIIKPEVISKSQNRVVDVFKKQSLEAGSQLVYWSYKPNYSAEFYSSGRAKATVDGYQLCLLLSNNVINYVVIDSDIPRKIPDDVLSKLTQVSVVSGINKQYRIMRSRLRSPEEWSKVGTCHDIPRQPN